VGIGPGVGVGSDDPQPEGTVEERDALAFQDSKEESPLKSLRLLWSLD